MNDLKEGILQALKKARASAALRKSVCHQLDLTAGLMPFMPNIIKRNIKYDNLVLCWKVNNKELYLSVAKFLSGKWKIELNGTIGEIWNEDYQISEDGFRKAFVWLMAEENIDYGK